MLRNALQEAIFWAPDERTSSFSPSHIFVWYSAIQKNMYGFIFLVFNLLMYV